MKFSRANWVAACKFHDLSDKEVLDEVFRRTHAAVALRPIVLLDLDSTLYDVGMRSYHILKNWASDRACLAFPHVRAALDGLMENQVGYSIKDTFLALGLDAEDARTKDALAIAKDYWSARFFNHKYLTYDRPYSGAVKFVRQLHALGAGIVYLTGRDEPNMGVGTREALLRDGFPWGDERCHSILKEHKSFPDLDHKIQAAQFVRARGTLVASLENEPLNIVGMKGIFEQHWQDAMHVFVDTLCSDHEAVPVDGLYRIRGFET